MTTLAQRTTPRKAFFATLDEHHGILTMDEHGAVWFRNDSTDALTLITPEMYPFVMPHGEVRSGRSQKTVDSPQRWVCRQFPVIECRKQ